MSTLGFAAEWFDPIAREVTKLWLKFFLEDGTIELIKNGIKQSNFLKRIHYPQVTIQDMYIGSTLSIYNRVIILTDYANSGTRDYLLSREVHFMCVVRKDALEDLTRIFKVVDQHRLSLGRVRTAKSTVKDINADPGDIVFEFVGIAGQKGEDFIGDIDRLQLPVAVTSIPLEDIAMIMNQFGGVDVPDNSTLCILKPHILRSGEAGACISEILEAGFKIEAFFSLHINLEIIEHLFDVYRGVYPNYNKMVEHVCSGPILAIMLTSNSLDTVSEFREFCGPYDSQLAKVLRPKSLRAKFGLNTVFNAVHCTDLSSDGKMECEYVFQTLADL